MSIRGRCPRTETQPRDLLGATSEPLVPSLVRNVARLAFHSVTPCTDEKERAEVGSLCRFVRLRSADHFARDTLNPPVSAITDFFGTAASKPWIICLNGFIDTLVRSFLMSRCLSSIDGTMELRHLRYFLTIAQTQNMRRASEKLHVTQPALSRQLRDLESELGVELFERLPRGLRLTDAGSSYRDEVSRVLELLADAGKRARRIALGEAGLLKLGYVEITAWEGIVPDALQAFTRKHPEMRLELAPADTPRQLKLIEDRDIDGGFVYSLGQGPENLHTRIVRGCNVVLAFPAAWANRIGAQPRLRDFTSFPFVAFPREDYPAYYDRILAACHAGGLIPQVVQHGHSESAVLSLVSAGIGVAIVNDANTARPPASVRFVRVHDLSIPLDLYFVHRTDNANPALRVFADQLDACIATTLPSVRD